jgi:hypothetical protein
MENNRLIEMINNYNSYSASKKAYIKRVLSSLREKSSERKDLVVMVNEWSFENKDENIREVDYIQCELCGQPENVYQFKIINKVTNEYIWTGSVCIENFSIPVYNKGKRLTNEDDINKIFKQNVKEIKEQKRLELIKAFIDNLNKPSTIIYLDRPVRYFKPYTMTKTNTEDGVYTLAQLKLIAAKYSDKYDNFITDDYISLFKVNMRLDKNKETLRELKPYQWAQFYSVLGKYMFTEENGFTEEVKQKAINNMKYYRPEYLSRFLKKITQKQKEKLLV